MAAFVGHPDWYVDDTHSIPDDEIVYRRVRPDAVNWSVTDSEGYPKINKNAFSDASEEEALRLGCPGRAMSLSISSVLDAHGLDPITYLLAEWPGYGLVCMTAGALRSHGDQGLQLWPTEDDVSHGVLFTTVPGNAKRGGGQERRTREAARWFKLPDRDS